MTKTRIAGAAFGALLATTALPALAQETTGYNVFVLQPGHVVVEGPAGLLYQVPGTVAVEVCSDVDQAIVDPGYAGSIEVTCIVTEEADVERVRAGAFDSNDDDDDGAPDPVPDEAEPAEPAPTEPAPTETEPTETEPAEPVPMDPAPTDPAPSEPAPEAPADNTDTDTGTDTGTDAGTDAGTEPPADEADGNDADDGGSTADDSPEADTTSGG